MKTLISTVIIINSDNKKNFIKKEFLILKPAIMSKTADKLLTPLILRCTFAVIDLKYIRDNSLNNTF
jgi:hypothetical protein